MPPSGRSTATIGPTERCSWSFANLYSPLSFGAESPFSVLRMRSPSDMLPYILAISRSFKSSSARTAAMSAGPSPPCPSGLPISFSSSSLARPLWPPVHSIIRIPPPDFLDARKKNPDGLLFFGPSDVCQTRLHCPPVMEPSPE